MTIYARVLDELREIRELVTAPLPKAMTFDRAARELSISIPTLRRMVRRGEISTVKISRRMMIPASEVERLTTPPEQKSRQPRPRRAQARYSVAEELRKLDAALKSKRKR